MKDPIYNLRATKKIRKIFYCQVCEKHIINKNKSSNMKSDTRKESEVICRINNTLTGKTYAYLNPEFDQVDGLVKRAVNDCTLYFQRFK